MLSQKNFEIEIVLLLCCLKQIVYFGSLDELKMYQLYKLINIRTSKHILSTEANLRFVDSFRTRP